MKKCAITLAFTTIFFSAFAQTALSYTAFIQQDTAIQWSAESDKVINLSPKVQAYSLKKWYLDKIRKGEATAYKMKNSGDVDSAYQLSMPELETQDWLKGLSIEIPPYKNPKEWYFYDKNIPNENYGRYKYRVGDQKFSADSCCGCDDADAFRTKQILNYKNGKFNIYNIFISPLCARQTGTVPMGWYPLCNVAYNDKADRKFPGVGKDVVLLNTDIIDYEFNREYPSASDSVLTGYRTDIGSLVYQDILKGIIKPVEIVNGKLIPAKKFLNWNMPVDTISAYNDNGEVTGYRTVQQERKISDLTHLLIKQDLYFDFKNEKLYSHIKWIELIEEIHTSSGHTLGYRPFCRIYY